MLTVDSIVANVCKEIGIPTVTNMMAMISKTPSVETTNWVIDFEQVPRYLEFFLAAQPEHSFFKNKWAAHMIKEVWKRISPQVGRYTLTADELERLLGDLQKDRSKLFDDFTIAVTGT